MHLVKGLLIYIVSQKEGNFRKDYPDFLCDIEFYNAIPRLRACCRISSQVYKV